ncbi:hypothetical protein Tco_1023553 [Tanacetum coccineum]
MYDEYRFRKTFRMARPIFNWIVDEVTSHSSFFHDNIDCTGREGISSLLKCTSPIRQLAYGVVPDFLDEYLQMTYLRKPIVTDVVKLYRHHEEKHGFSRILGSLDCTD